MKVQIADSAAFHLREAYSFYEGQDAGAGGYFYECVLQDIDRLASSAGVHSKGHKTYYKVNCSHHPFAIYYTIQGETVTVKAVLDSRRNPAWITHILSRLRKQNP